MKDWILIRLIGLCETPLNHNPGDLSIRFNDEDITVKAMAFLEKEFEEREDGAMDEGMNKAMVAFAYHTNKFEESEQFLDDFYERGEKLRKQRSIPD